MPKLMGVIALFGLAGGSTRAMGAILTSAATRAGFALSTDERGYVNSGIGRVGLTVVGANVWTTDCFTGYLNIRPDVDGQTYSTSSNYYGPGVAGLTVL